MSYLLLKTQKQDKESFFQMFLSGVRCPLKESILGSSILVIFL